MTRRFLNVLAIFLEEFADGGDKCNTVASPSYHCLAVANDNIFDVTSLF